MLLKLLRYLRGYVCFKASGRFPERFLNSAAVGALNLWDAYPSEGGISGKMSASDYRRARHIARRSGTRLKITKKRGLPFVIKKHSDRIGLPIGALAGAALLIVLSQFIWTVDIVGAKTVSDSRIRQALESSGVYPGGFKGAVDVMSAQRDVQFEIDELSWVSINTLGCKSTVDVREKAKKSDVQNDASPCNIKAKRDGVIIKINAAIGFNAVEVGSGVAKGDLLVSGVMPTQQDTIRFVRAKAEVYADFNSKYELKIPKSYNYYSLSENKTNRNELNFLWISFPVSLDFRSFPESVSTVSRKNLSLDGNVLPLGITTQTTRGLDELSVALTPEQASLSFEKSLLLNEVFENGDCAVKSRLITIEDERDHYLCRCDSLYNQNIAQTVDFSVTEN